MKGEQMIADQFLESSLWDLLWSRINYSLKPQQQQLNEEQQKKVRSAKKSFLKFFLNLP